VCSVTTLSDAGRRTGAPDPITHVAVKAWRGRFLELDRKLPEESAVALSYDRVTFAVMMASPQDLHDFAVGFSLSEGIIERPADILEFELAVLPLGLAGAAAAEPGDPRGSRRRLLHAR
jgi:FdhD protein